MVFLAAVVVGLVFGAGDQFVGSLNAWGLWTVSLSLLSAPWLVLPFAVGCSQLRSRRAAVVGLVVTLSALAGYFLMIMSPFEGGRSSLNLAEVHGLLVSNRLNIAGGLVTGPLYGLLGQRWRTRRAWWSAVAVAGALCLEPVAQTIAQHSYPGESIVWPGEVIVGIALAAYFLVAGIGYRRRRGSPLGKPTNPTPV